MDATLTPSRIVEAVLFAVRQNEGSHPSERDFAARLAKNPEIMNARLGRMRYVCGVLEVKPGDVLLDVGSGIGLNSILALLCGAAEVHSVEMTPDRLSSARLIARFLQVEDRIHIHGDDVLALELPPESIDAAFSFELLEHIRDVGGLYDRLARWLGPGCRAYGRTGANGRNLLYNVIINRGWRAVDRANYVRIREETIRRIVPAIPEKDLQLLVERTRGELIADVERVALEYQRNAAIPSARAPSVARDPVTGQFMERMLDPTRMMRVMDAQGFRTTLLAPCFDHITTVRPILAAAQKWAGALIRATHPASLAVAPWLEFLSRSESAPQERRGEGTRSTSRVGDERRGGC